MGETSRKVIRMTSAWVRRWLEVKGGGPNLRWRGPPYREPEPLPGVHPGQPARENGGEKTDIRSDSQFPRVEGMKPDDQSADQTNTMCPQIRICGHNPKRRETRLVRCGFLRLHRRSTCPRLACHGSSVWPVAYSCAATPTLPSLPHALNCMRR